ncbi:MAG TPA: TniQ family protein [Acetobacteraceae bacterium]|nr:TniQ family protein [Acetobacteraceae bacterium]
MMRLFAFRPKPLPGEILSSWICRTAAGHNGKLHSFCHYVWPGRQMWNRDPDWSCPSDVVETMARGTGTAPEVARATHLRSLEGRLYETHRPNAKTPWIRPIGVWHRKRLNPGLQYCAACLAEDATPYFRIAWRLGFAAACLTHRTILRETCTCGAALNFHRMVAHGELCQCDACGADLRATAMEPAAPDALAFQRHLFNALERSVADLGSYGPVASVRYFVLIHQLLKMLTSRKCADRLLYRVRLSTGLDVRVDPSIARNIEVDRLPPRLRHDLLRAAAVLVDRWPEPMVELCSAARVWSSAVLADLEDPPFPLWDVARRDLNRTFYRPNEREVQAMRRSCAAREIRPSGHALRKLTGRDCSLFFR